MKTQLVSRIGFVMLAGSVILAGLLIVVAAFLTVCVFVTEAFKAPPNPFGRDLQILTQWGKLPEGKTLAGYHVEMQVIDPDEIKQIDPETDDPDATDEMPDFAPGEIGYYTLKDVIINREEPPILVLPLADGLSCRFRFQPFFTDGTKAHFTPWTDWTNIRETSTPED